MSAFVYILASKTKVIYTGVTADLERRVYQHKQKEFGSSFTKRYNVDRLVYFEETDDITVAIAREKEIKGWLRKKKIALIESQNLHWKDLAADWFE